MRIPRKLMLGLIAVLAILGLGAGLTACDSGHYAQPVQTVGYDQYAPSAPVSFGGQSYCAWMYTPQECIGQPWPAAPMGMGNLNTQPGAGTLLAALFLYHLTYHSFFDSGYYYDDYLVPHHVTVVNRTTYVINVQHFDSTYSRQESQYSVRANYKDTTTGKTVGAKVPTNAFSGGNAKNAGSAPTATATRGVVGNAPAVQPTKPAPTRSKTCRKVGTHTVCS